MRGRLRIETVLLALAVAWIPTARADDGVWSALTVPPALPNTGLFVPGAIDPVRREMWLGAANLWKLTLTGTPAWSHVVPTGTAPTEKYQSAIYDPLHDRMLFFGGEIDNVGPTNRLFALSLGASPAWSLLSPAGTPPPARAFHTAIYDSANRRMVVFAGEKSGAWRNDVWALDLDGPETWYSLPVNGTPPGGRERSQAVYDPVGQRMIVYGGYGFFGFWGDVWTLSLDATPTWSEISTGPGPVARDNHAMVLDPFGSRALVYGGSASTGPLNDLWALDLTTLTWQRLDSGASNAPPSAGAALAFDRAGSRMILNAFGTWRFDVVPDAADWSSFVPSPPPAFTSGASVFDPDQKQMIRFGDDGQTWVLPLEATSPSWSRVYGSGSPPGRSSSAGVWDPVRARMLMFGGDGFSVTANELWAFTPSVSTWARITTSGSSGSARTLPGLGYDPVGDRLLLFGGNASDANTYVLPLSGAGALTWSVLTTAGAPPSPRHGHGTIFDPASRRLIVMDGVNDFSAPNPPIEYDDLWTLALDAATPTWTSWNRVPRPAQRKGHAVALDPLGNRMMVFGGFRATVPTTYQDTWSLFLPDLTWTQLAPAGGPPPARRFSAVALDPGQHRLAISGGTGTGGTLSDTWFLDWTPTTAVGGSAENAGLGVESIAFNRGTRTLRVVARIDSERAAKIELLDLSGRIVARRSVERSDPHVALDVSRLRSGIFFLRLAQQGRQVSRKVALVF